jgi:hypothetical protein
VEVGHSTAALVLKRAEPKKTWINLACGTDGDERCCILVGPIKLEDEIKITGGTLLQRS